MFNIEMNKFKLSLMKLNETKTQLDKPIWCIKIIITNMLLINDNK